MDLNSGPFNPDICVNQTSQNCEDHHALTRGVEVGKNCTETNTYPGNHITGVWHSRHQPPSGCHRSLFPGSSPSVVVFFVLLQFLPSLLCKKKNQVALLNHNLVQSSILANGWWLSWIKAKSLSNQLNLRVSGGPLGSRPWSSDLSTRFPWEGVGQTGRGGQKWPKEGEVHYGGGYCIGRLDERLEWLP